jgi:hypothetical protein
MIIGTRVESTVGAGAVTTTSFVPALSVGAGSVWSNVKSTPGVSQTEYSVGTGALWSNTNAPHTSCAASVGTGAEIAQSFVPAESVGAGAVMSLVIVAGGASAGSALPSNRYQVADVLMVDADHDAPSVDTDADVPLVGIARNVVPLYARNAPDAPVDNVCDAHVVPSVLVAAAVLLADVTTRVTPSVAIPAHAAVLGKALACDAQLLPSAEV